MLRNNLIIAFRSFRKNRVFTVINVLGLSAGLTACILIALYVRFELSYDDFHTDAANMYRVTTTVKLENEIITRESSTYSGIIEALKNDLPDVQATTAISAFDSEGTFLRIRNSNGGVTPLTGYRGLYADESFFKVFSFPLVNGNAADLLKTPYSAVISERLAQEYFSNDAIGKILEFKDDDRPAKQVTVRGIMKDVPANSHVKFDIIVNLPDQDGNFWEWRGHAYLKLIEGRNPNGIEERLNALALDKNGLKIYADDYGQISTFSLQPITDIHLYSRLEDEFEPGGSGLLVYALVVFAILILIIGWSNYVNLSTAIHFQKIRQIAIRKIVGASKRTLTLQILTESALLNVVALTVAIFLSWNLLSTFSDLIGIHANALNFLDPGFWMGALVFVLISTIVSGAYPALAIVSASPVSAMKGKVHTQSNFSIGKALLVFQFTTATVFIITTITAYRQLTFMQSKELGINIDQVMVVKAFNFDQETWSDSAGGYVVDPVYKQRTLAFSDELRNLKDVVNMASLSHLPGQSPNWGTEFRVYDLDPSKGYSLKAVGVDYDFIPTLEVTLLAGRNFSREYPSDRGNEEKRAIIINETASKLLGFRNPQQAVSRHISTYWGADYEIIGVVRSFHQLSLKEDLTPLYFILQPRALPYFAIDLQTDNLLQLITEIKSIWSRHFPEYPFDYLFLDDYFNRQYQSEVKFTNVTGIFTVLGVFIGCMGLFGLTSHAIVQRTKEIGIRKVLGASVANVIAIFSSDFMKLIILANLIAIPAAYSGISLWLENYAYRTSLVWWVFVVPVVLILLLALATISAQTVKVALKNPVESLKCE